MYAAVSRWKIFSNIRSSSISSSPVIGFIRGTTELGIGGNDSPERGVARDEGTEVLIRLDLLLDRLRDPKLNEGGAKPGELTVDWKLPGPGIGPFAN